VLCCLLAVVVACALSNVNTLTHMDELINNASADTATAYVGWKDACGAGDIARVTSYRAAKAVLGGRFENLKQARAHGEFAEASLVGAKAIYRRMSLDPLAIAAAKAAEQQRKDDIRAAVESNHVNDQGSRQDLAFLEMKFESLIEKANASALDLGDMEIAAYAWDFELANLEDRRYWAYRFMYSVYSDLVDKAKGGMVMGGEALHSITKRIFLDGVYSLRNIRNGVRAGIPEPEPVGRRPSFPRKVESVLFRFVAKLRSLKTPVFKSTVIGYAQRLLEGTAESLNFAKVVDGEYVVCEYGGVEWDTVKLDNWYHRRFIGDRKADGASTGNQRLLDTLRAKWQTFDNMEAYYLTHVQVHLTLTPTLTCTARLSPATTVTCHDPHLHGPHLHGPHLHGPHLHGPHLHGPHLHGPHLHGPHLHPHPHPPAPGTR
jgi:hypothetical protein